MLLFIMRHGLAEEPTPKGDDSARKLTAKRAQEIWEELALLPIRPSAPPSMFRNYSILPSFTTSAFTTLVTCRRRD